MQGILISLLLSLTDFDGCVLAVQQGGWKDGDTVKTDRSSPFFPELSICLCLSLCLSLLSLCLCLFLSLCISLHFSPSLSPFSSAASSGDRGCRYRYNHEDEWLCECAKQRRTGESCCGRSLKPAAFHSTSTVLSSNL